MIHNIYRFVVGANVLCCVTWLRRLPAVTVGKLVFAMIITLVPILNLLILIYILAHLLVALLGPIMRVTLWRRK